jgi:large subunit ribosomal protein L23
MAISKKTPKVKAPAKKLSLSVSPNLLIQKPHITEKSAKANEKSNVYTFIVHKNANKTEIAKALTFLYDVTPVKVRIVNVKPEVIFKGGKAGTKKAYKKAIVTITKGQSISFA